MFSCMALPQPRFVKRRFNHSIKIIVSRATDMNTDNSFSEQRMQMPPPQSSVSQVADHTPQRRTIDKSSNSRLGCGFDSYTGECKQRVFTGEAMEAHAHSNYFNRLDEDTNSHNNSAAHLNSGGFVLRKLNSSHNTQMSFSMSLTAQRLESTLVSAKPCINTGQAGLDTSGAPVAVNLRTLGDQFISSEVWGGRITMTVTVDCAEDARNESVGFNFSEASQIKPLSTTIDHGNSTNLENMKNWPTFLAGESESDSHTRRDVRVDIQKTGGAWDSTALESAQSTLQKELTRTSWGNAVTLFVKAGENMMTYLDQHPQAFEVLERKSKHYSYFNAPELDATLTQEMQWRQGALDALTHELARQVEQYKMGSALIQSDSTINQSKHKAKLIMQNAAANCQAIGHEVKRLSLGVPVLAGVKVKAEDYATAGFLATLKPINLLSSDVLATALMQYQSVRLNRAKSYLTAIRTTVTAQHDVAEKTYHILLNNRESESYLHTGRIGYEQNIRDIKSALDASSHNLRLLNELLVKIETVVSDPAYHALCQRLSREFKQHIDARQVPHRGDNFSDNVWKALFGSFVHYWSRYLGSRAKVEQPDMSSFPLAIEPEGP